ncbi:phospholipase C [Cupriavidus basilensis OR16]|uniref:Phospholipase C n=2 Tax=Cupriavidus basilensis TaxID=68895 RepID=H1RZL6_9BURK|nr:phospholipase C [Cupriavidus basilensis OR16]
MLGALKAFDTSIDGIDPQHPGINFDEKNQQTFSQQDVAATFVRPDFKVPHEFDDVQEQIRDGMGHFVDAYCHANQQAPATDGDQVMGYFPDGALPVLHALAKNFLVCDRWFSSMPGPTWPNRLFAHSGTSLGDVLMPDGVLSTVRMFFGRYSQPTIYDRLDDKQIPWKIYHGGVPQSIVLNRLKPQLFSSRFQSMDGFVADCAGPEQAFPSYAFIEPRYFAGLAGEENDQHSPAGVVAGEQLIADVYNAIRKNQALWESTLLIVTYDEHGGFYDHVLPPPTIAPDDHTDIHAFDRLGVRVPAILVSPWVARGVDHTVYDHTSILRYVCEKWQLPHLCRRTQPAFGANVTGNFASAISLAKARTDTPPPSFAGAPRLAALAATGPADFGDAQTALVSYAELVRQEIDAQAMQASGKSMLAARAVPAAGVPPVDQRAKAIEQWMIDAKQVEPVPVSNAQIALPQATVAVAPAGSAPLPAASGPVVAAKATGGRSNGKKRPQRA